MSTVVAERGQSYLVEDRGRCYIVSPNDVTPVPSVDAALGRGYWEPFEGDPAPILARVPLTAAAVDYTDGSMVALYPDPDTAAILAVPDGQPPETLHVTLAFLPEGVVYPEELAEDLAELAGWHQPLDGKVGGLGMFEPGEHGVPVIALADVPGIAELQVDVIEALRALGVPVADTHGFTPHITLSYGTDVEGDAADLIGVPLRFGHLCLVVGPEKWELPLGSAVTAAFEEGKHPRHPKGTHEGGRFAPKKGDSAADISDKIEKLVEHIDEPDVTAEDLGQLAKWVADGKVKFEKLSKQARVALSAYTLVDWSQPLAASAFQVLLAAYVESEHPRDPGGEGGGQWVAKYAAQVGVTPFRPEDDPQGFYESDKYQTFERSLVPTAKRHGVTIDAKDRVSGFWQGDQEPSLAVDVHDGVEGVRDFAEELRSRWDQDAVLLFSPSETGSAVSYKMPATGDIAGALTAAGVDGATIYDGGVEIIGGAEDGEKVLDVARRLGVDPGKVSVRTGDLSFVEREG